MMVDQTGHIEDLPLTSGMDFSQILDEELLRWITEAEYLGVSRETAILIATKRRALKINKSSELKVTTNKSDDDGHINGGDSSSRSDNEANITVNTTDNKYVTKTEVNSNLSKYDKTQEYEDEVYDIDDHENDYDDEDDYVENDEEGGRVEEDYVDNEEYVLKTNLKDSVFSSSIGIVTKNGKVSHTNDSSDINSDSGIANDKLNVPMAVPSSISLSQLQEYGENTKCSSIDNTKNSNTNATVSFGVGLLDKIVDGAITNSTLNSHPKLEQKRRKKKNHNNNNSHHNRRRKRLNCYKQQSLHSNPALLPQTGMQPTVVMSYKNKEDSRCNKNDCLNVNLMGNSITDYSIFDNNLIKQSRTLSNATLLNKIIEKNSKANGNNDSNLSDDNSSVDTTMGVVNSGFDSVDNINGFSSALDAIVAAHTCNPFNNYQNHNHNRVQGNSRARRKRRYHVPRNNNVQGSINNTEKASSFPSSMIHLGMNTVNSFSGTAVSGAPTKNLNGSEEKHFDGTEIVSSSLDSNVFPEPSKITYYRNSKRQLYKHRKRSSQSFQNHQTSCSSSCLHCFNKNNDTEAKNTRQTLNTNNYHSGGSNNQNYRNYSKKIGGSENSTSVRPKPKKSEAVEHVREQLRITFRSRGVLGV
ncbi:hypothetical protein FG379_000402 [Cryptosporidium bovis]|uniref:uncharacterized protein n=1 Tax=Cryptosporidium bovis TaxID=310047 RepID=UPI00351A0860|nr:hypothetical protein FG379_000402 [Cryptosporidium bovis]